MRLFLLVLGPTLFLINVIAKIPQSPCKSHADHETCLLYWITNTGVDMDMDNPYDIAAWAHATIYSPSCLVWGATTNGLGSNVKVYALGLDYTDPLILNPATRPDVGYNTPQFEYKGEVWGYEDCQCQVGNLEQETHICRCPFRCEPVPIIG